MAQKTTGLDELRVKLDQLARETASHGNAVYETTKSHADLSQRFGELWAAVSALCVAGPAFWKRHGADADRISADLATAAVTGTGLQNSAAGLAATLREAIALAGKLSPSDGPAPPPTPPTSDTPKYPWAKLFKNGRAPSSGRKFLSGITFGNGPGDHELFMRFMGCAPDAVGGGVLGGGHALVEAGWEVYAKELGTRGIRGSEHCSWLWETKRQASAVFVPCTTSVPHGLKLADWQDVAAGKYHARLFAYGKAMAETFKDLGLDTDLIVFRPDWEMNQDTGFRPYFFQNGGTIPLWTKMITAAWTAIGEGLGFKPQVVFSPARQPPIEGLPGYERFLDCEVYTAVDCTHHPAKKNTGPGKSELSIYGGAGATEWSPGLALEVARKRGLPVMLCETSIGYGFKAFGDPGDATPLPAEMPRCWELFGQWVDANAGVGPGKIGMVLQHNERMLRPNFMRDYFASHKATDMLGYGAAWEKACEVHRKWFGKAP